MKKEKDTTRNQAEDLVTATYTFEMNFASGGYGSYTENVLSIIPKFFEILDYYKKGVLIFSENSKIISLFYNYCVCNNLHPFHLYYPQKLILEIISKIKLDTLNFEKLIDFQKDVLQKVQYPNLCVYDSEFVKDHEVWIEYEYKDESKEKKFIKIDFVNL